ncbi:MAG: ABC transporter substrate-binding protein [Acidimicrobiia bacterium]
MPGRQTQPGDDLANYRLGMLSDTSTDNYWAARDTKATFWSNYVLMPTKSALYRLNFPGIDLTNDLAANSAVPAGATEGGGWAIEVAMREDATWSDSEPVTANDIVFTFATVRDLALGGNWLSSYPLPDPENPNIIGLIDVQAVDDYRVKFVFNHEPGLSMWPHGVGLAPIMPAHAWEGAVEAAKASDDPAATLYGVPGTGLDLSSGPMIFEERQEGSYSRSSANADYYDRGLDVTSGGVSYTVGPFAGDVTFSVYSDQAAAVLALKAGEVDYLLNPLGMQRGFLSTVQDDPNLTPVINPTYGFHYLAFNLRKEPMSIQGFRDALALMIDKEFMANNLFQGAAFPQYATMPEGNTRWYNAELAERFAAEYVGKTIQERLEGAVQLLRDAGFTWEIEPTVATDAEGNPLNAVNNGVGIIYNGVPVRPLEILAPGQGYDPLRATYSIWIETWLNQLGFDAEANPTDFNALVAEVDPDINNELSFDMFILGWGLGNPAFPYYHKLFFYGQNDVLLNRGSNRPGYHSDEFDALAEEFDAAQSEEEAYEIIWQMEEIIFRDKPYIVLFDTSILEFYRSESVAYPFTETLSGLQFLQGMQSLVAAAK